MRLATLLVPIALAFTVSLAHAESVIGIGIFGGVGSPSGDMVDITKESKSGAHFGMRIPMAFAKMFSLEPYMARTEGCPDSAYFGTLDGADVTSFGVNVALGRLVNNNGFNIAPYAGIGLHKFRRELHPNDDPIGWKAGLALGLYTGKNWHWNLRGEYNALEKLLDEPEGRKYINVSLGITCVVSPR